jgi:hypothetical protein
VLRKSSPSLLLTGGDESCSLDVLTENRLAPQHRLSSTSNELASEAHAAEDGEAVLSLLRVVGQLKRGTGEFEDVVQ